MNTIMVNTLSLSYELSESLYLSEQGSFACGKIMTERIVV